MKEGEQVLCVDLKNYTGGLLREGNIYTIHRLFEDGGSRVDLREHRGSAFFKHRFISWPDEIDSQKAEQGKVPYQVITDDPFGDLDDFICELADDFDDDFGDFDD